MGDLEFIKQFFNEDKNRNRSYEPSAPPLPTSQSYEPYEPSAPTSQSSNESCKTSDTELPPFLLKLLEDDEEPMPVPILKRTGDAPRDYLDYTRERRPELELLYPNKSSRQIAIMLVTEYDTLERKRVYMRRKLRKLSTTRTENDNEICTVCYENKKNVAFQCEHMCCSECALNISRMNNLCYLCKKRIESIIPIFD